MASVGGSAVIVTDNDGDAITISNGRLAVETEQDDAFSSWVN